MQSWPPISFLLLSLVLYGQGAPPDNWLRTWKLNPAKSNYQFGTMPKSRTLSFASVPGGVKATSDLLDDIGIVHIEFEAKYNGPDVPMRDGNPGPMMFVKRTGSYTF